MNDAASSTLVQDNAGFTRSTVLLTADIARLLRVPRVPRLTLSASIKVDESTVDV